MRNRARVIALLLPAVLLAVALLSPANALEAPRMPLEELKANLGNPGIIIIDVRAFTDWLLTSQKIKGAVRENPRQLDTWIGKYAKDQTIVLYCA
ncbi:MAG: rhodanese-like domain-containing protein [Nitrospirota bacterium]|nr:rhodanese-like domain-containing protein [Nitrospirota bacterium]